jgi:hypothetical protein
MEVTCDDRELDRGWEITDPEDLMLYNLAEPLLQTRLNTLHTRIAYHFAEILLEKEGGDAVIVTPAILLHDVGWSLIPEEDQIGAFGPKVKKPRLQRLHETEGARLARGILEELGHPEDHIREIEKIINGHDTRTDSLGINDSVVKDADKLWRYTFEGFTIDYMRFKQSPEENLNWLIESIPDWFFTETSVRLAHEEADLRRTEYEL